jgi:carnitine 3-dehydrogenase
VSRKAAIIGAGVIGAGWAARLIEHGIDVVIHDPAAAAPRLVREVLANAERAYAKLGPVRPPHRGEVAFAEAVAAAVDGAEWIVESVPERLSLKQRVYAAIEASAPEAAIIASSTSGLLPSELQADLRHPERFLVGHPFNPVYLIPAVEIVAGRLTAEETVERAMVFYAALGMKPIRIRKEIEAFVADRLLEALWRESL